MPGSCILGDMTRISVTHLSDLRGLICRRQTWHCYRPHPQPPLLFSAKDSRKYLLLQKIQSRRIRKICNFKVKCCIFKMVDNGSAIWGGGGVQPSPDDTGKNLCCACGDS